MSILSMSSSRATPETEFDHITQLAVALSGQLTRVHADEVPLAVAEALSGVASAVSADYCRFIEFGESGLVARTHQPPQPERPGGSSHQPPAMEPWLIARLARCEAVNISRPEDVPREAPIWNVSRAARAARWWVCRLRSRDRPSARS